MNLNIEENEVNLSINLKNLELVIGPNRIPIKDKYTLILGKFKGEVFKDYQNEVLIQIIEKIDSIPAKKLITYFQNQSDKLKGLFKVKLQIIPYLSFTNDFHLSFFRTAIL